MQTKIENSYAWPKESHNHWDRGTPEYQGPKTPKVSLVYIFCYGLTMADWPFAITNP